MAGAKLLRLAAPVMLGKKSGSRWITPVSYANGGALIAIRHDDGFKIDYDTEFGELVSQGLVAGFPIVVGTVGDATHFSYAQARTMQAAGMELMNHSLSHGVDPANDAAFIAENVTSKVLMTAQGLDVANWVTPGTYAVANAYRPTTTAFYGTPADLALRSVYGAYSGYFDSYFCVPGSNYSFDLPIPVAHRFGISYMGLSDGTKTLAQMMAFVDRAIVEQRGLVILIHTWELDSGGKTTWADWRALKTYIAFRKNQGYLAEMTPTQLLFAQPSGTAREKLLALLDCETNDFGQWTSNSDAAHITVAAGGLDAVGAHKIAVNITSTTAFYLSWQNATPYSLTGKVGVECLFDPNTLTMATNDAFDWLRFYDHSYNTLFSLILKKSASSYQLAMYYYTTSGITTSYYDITDDPHKIEVYETKGAGSGTITWKIDGVVKDAVTGINNNVRFADFGKIRLGGVANLGAGTSGTFYVGKVLVNETANNIGGWPLPS